MRPNTHREQVPAKRCGNCRHSAVPDFKDHLLCFHGDPVRYVRLAGCTAIDVYLDGKCVGTMDGDQYDKVWGGRVVDPTDVCDEWEADAAGGVDGTPT